MSGDPRLKIKSNTASGSALDLGRVLSPDVQKRLKNISADVLNAPTLQEMMAALRRKINVGNVLIVRLGL